MSRFIDRLVYDGFSLPDHMANGLPKQGVNPINYMESVREQFKGSVVINAQNVADYFYRSGGFPKQWNIDKDFPCLSPPFDQCFIEYVLPKDLADADNVVNTVGALFSSPSDLPPEITHLIDKGQSDVTYVEISIFIEITGGARFGPVLFVWLALSRVGEVVGFHVVYSVRANSSEEQGVEAARRMLAVTGPALLAVSFLHCKNVGRIESQPDPKLERARARRGKPPLLKFYVLDIKTPTRILDDAGAQGGGLRRALHICRGHFAYYSEHRPLFGKHVGRFWVPQHTRGHASQGTVVKDYRIGVIR